MASGADRISALPDELLHHVMSFLPMHEYVDNLLLLQHPGTRLDSFNLNECDFSFKPFLPTYDVDVNTGFQIALLCQARVTLKRSTLDFSGCPTLVNLKMKECDINGNVPSPFLKHLSITSCYFVTRSFRARIYMPGLISLVLSECTHRTPLLENMPLLVLVIVRVKDCENKCSKSTYGDCGDHTCLSQVTELELSVDSTVFIVNRDLKLCPTFCKLKTLFLSAWCPGVAADRNVLTCFLQHSPIMEKLVLQLPKVPKDRVGTESSYKRSEHSFICSHLKIVDLKCEEVDGRVQETLEILSTYGIPLEHVNIQQTDMVSGP
ncbi:hypothetical protein SETIT_3G280200v2 [Setaria italica]|uniref:F-box domain-containing protein n=1 Tax=Setaria italica TaxID=4555 RepID=A0A368QJN5_SETIT|nr:hypothetical protein SETIT_3G280200v2 [Setaria italica]